MAIYLVILMSYNEVNKAKEDTTMTYTVRTERKIRMAGRNVCNWERPYFESEFEVDESGKDLFIHMHEDLQGYHKIIHEDGSIRLYQQTACNECEVITITEKK